MSMAYALTLVYTDFWLHLGFQTCFPVERTLLNPLCLTTFYYSMTSVVKFLHYRLEKVQ